MKKIPNSVVVGVGKGGVGKTALATTPVRHLGRGTRAARAAR